MVFVQSGILGFMIRKRGSTNGISVATTVGDKQT